MMLQENVQLAPWLFRIDAEVRPAALKPLFEKELDASEIEQRKLLHRIIVDEQVEIAAGTSLVARGRAEQIKRGRPHGPDGRSIFSQLRDGFGSVHGASITELRGGAPDHPA